MLISLHGISFQLGRSGNLYPEIINPAPLKSLAFISALNCKTSTRLEPVSFYLGSLHHYRPILIRTAPALPSLTWCRFRNSTKSLSMPKAFPGRCEAMLGQVTIL